MGFAGLNPSHGLRRHRPKRPHRNVKNRHHRTRHIISRGSHDNSRHLHRPIALRKGPGSRPHLAFVLQEGRENANIRAGSGFIWRIPGQKRLM